MALLAALGLLPGAAVHPVERHVGVWTSAPKLVPGTAQQPDGPLAGNGDFGVVIGGGRECCGGQCCGGPGVLDADLGFFFGKNDYVSSSPSRSYWLLKLAYVTWQSSHRAGPRCSIELGRQNSPGRHWEWEEQRGKETL